ncbi:MAG: hypothetical protein E6Q97_05465 [Desulfurellales bacterium]|nr:MAG: hypothetical protein E6Q97_05465 [Desulfurellales bacterium]
MRAPPGDHWSDTLPAVDRERYSAAWQDYRCCRDCIHWSDDEDGIGVCGTVTIGAFITPEDYTCDDFKATNS